MLIASRICAFLAISLLAVAGYEYVTRVEEPPFGQALTVHEPDRDLGTLPIGEHELRFRITNASSQNLRVIDAAVTWGAVACFGPKLDGQIPIPAHGEIELECKVRIGRVGEFVSPCQVFFEDGGIRTIVLSVKGVAK